MHAKTANEERRTQAEFIVASQREYIREIAKVIKYSGNEVTHT